MPSIDPKSVSTRSFYSYLVGAVAPRPIAMVSTVDKEGNPNLAPFSFFNVFSSNPPILVFSPSRSGKEAKSKNTFENVLDVPEVVINMVNYDMLHQTSLAGHDYPKGVNEFEKSGFTPLTSEKVQPFRLKESPVQMECKVLKVIELGQEAGAGNLVVCEVVMMHVNEDVLDEHQHINPHKMDLVARLGGDWYARINGTGLFEVSKKVLKNGIGIDQIPDYIRNSNVLTGNNLGQLGTVDRLPSQAEVEEFKKTKEYEALMKSMTETKHSFHQPVKELLDEDRVEEAWLWLLAYGG